jgi:hypothetical protein
MTDLRQAAQPPDEWELIKNILAEYGLDAIAFVAQWKAAQCPWQGLTEGEVQLHALAHRRMVNAYYDAARETNLVTETFDAPGFYKDIERALKEKNETR